MFVKMKTVRNLVSAAIVDGVDNDILCWFYCIEKYIEINLKKKHSIRTQ